MVPHFTLGEHFGPVPSPNSTTTHTRGTLPPNSVAQGGRAARSGNISARFRRPMWPRRTLKEHFGSVPSPNSTTTHARATFLPRFRRPTVPRRTLGRHLRPFPSPNGAAAHARATLTPNSVAQRGITTRSGDTYARFRRPTGHYHTLGRHFCPVPSPNGAAPHAQGTLPPVSVAQR